MTAYAGFLTWLMNLLFSRRFTAVLMVDEVIHSSLDFFFLFVCFFFSLEQKAGYHRAGKLVALVIMQFLPILFSILNDICYPTKNKASMEVQNASLSLMAATGSCVKIPRFTA